MAPQLLLSQLLPTTLQGGLAALMLLCCALSLFMCASHTRKWRRRWNSCTNFLVDDGPVIQHMQPGGNDESMDDSGDQEDPVWQKNILMGGKCQLPDFSGVIIYDAEGNIVKPDKTPRLTWK
ncbi:uncharacterized protein LOC126783956 [Argentina anserina]|uniref:uncharacterized protein LOC126783956 n=1 Tax=Argentina anserina TaxID=57926 RepID=UPI002176884B|nr:uncharacterized protein LOC126783956 [Potentilla anserina]